MNKKQTRIVEAVSDGYHLGHNAGHWILYKESQLQGRLPRKECEHLSHKECHHLLECGTIRRCGTFRGPDHQIFDRFVLTEKLKSDKTEGSGCYNQKESASVLLHQ